MEINTVEELLEVNCNKFTVIVPEDWRQRDAYNLLCAWEIEREFFEQDDYGGVYYTTISQRPSDGLFFRFLNYQSEYNSIGELDGYVEVERVYKETITITKDVYMSLEEKL